MSIYFNFLKKLSIGRSEVDKIIPVQFADQMQIAPSLH